MNEQPIPMCKAALLCSWLSRDAGSDQWTVAGMYDALVYETYPSVSRPILWYVKLADVRGTYEITPRIVDPEGQVIDTMPVGVIAGRGPLYGAEFGGSFRSVIFRYPGKYALQVLCGPIKTQSMSPNQLDWDVWSSVPKRPAELDIVVNCEFEVGPLSKLAPGLTLKPGETT